MSVRTRFLRTVELVRGGPGLGLSRIPLLRRVHNALESAGAFTAHRIGRKPVEVEAYDFRFRVDPSDRQVGLSLLLHGTYEPEEARLFEETVKPGMVVVDAGANLGVYTLLAARKAGPEGRVVAVEPDPGTFALLSENISLNGVANATALCVALGAEAGRTSLYRVAGHPALASLSSLNARDSSEQLSVEVSTLDESLAALDIERVDVLKLDTQGAEIGILRGARETLSRARPIMFLEYWAAGLVGMGQEPEELLAEVDRWGYELSLVTEPDVRIEREEVIRLGRAGAIDLLLRPTREVRG